MEDDKKENWWDRFTKSMNPLGESITKSIKKRLDEDEEEDPKKKALKKLAE